MRSSSIDKHDTNAFEALMQLLGHNYQSIAFNNNVVDFILHDILIKYSNEINTVYQTQALRIRAKRIYIFFS